MTPLETAGRALYGSAWQTPMAEALSVADRTVRRWYAGESRIPPGIWPELRKMLVSHSQTCRAIAGELPT